MGEFRDQILSVAGAAIILLGVSTCDDPGLVSKPRPVREVISIAPFDGAHVQLIVTVTLADHDVIEYPCNTTTLRCGSEPLVQTGGERTTWIWNDHGWSLLVYQVEEGEPL